MSGRTTGEDDLKICAITGHRELPVRYNVNAVYDALEELIRGGCTHFRCGMARGFDLAALGCLVDLRKKYPFTIEACIPYAGHDRGFSPEERARFRSLLAWCDKETVLFSAYTRGCFLARDRYMVDGADVLFAYCVRESGGAAYTVKYAEKKGVPVIFVEL